MDHLPTATNPVKLAIEIPYICQETYQLGSFQEYPEFRGFQTTRISALNGEENFHQDLPSLLQEWLYFGLLEEFVGKSFDHNLICREFSTGSCWRKVIYTLRLPKLLGEFRNRVSELTTEGGRELCQTLVKYIDIAMSKCALLDRNSKWAHKSPLPEILISIQMLIDSLIITLIECGCRTDSLTERRYKPLADEMEYEPLSTSILLNHMMQNNWCIHQARSICQRFTFIVAHYLATFPRMAHPHGHEECIGRSQCVANNTNPNAYQNRHIEKGCECKFLSLNNEEVKKIIKHGGIPLVQISEVSEHRIQLRVIRAKYRTKYTAISHVWSDGLGNPDANALPACQVRRIMQRVKEGEFENSRSSQSIFIMKNQRQSVCIWMDTMCIPVNDRMLKLKAINRMIPTFKRATRVLVLDSSFDGMPSESKETEVCAKLILSTWNTRSWTLQEGALATNIRFPLPKRVPHKLPVTQEERYIARQLHESHQLPAVGRWSANEGRTGRQCQFTSVWNELSRRSTTMMDDVHGIFATLLDFHTEEILLLDRKERMKAILCAQETLPIKLLYIRNARRSTLGSLDRWVPDVPAGCTIQKGDSWMAVTESGLRIGAEDVVNRAFMIEHEPRREPLKQYFVAIPGIGIVEIEHCVTSCRPYPKAIHKSTLLHLTQNFESILEIGMTATGVSLAVTGSEGETICTTCEDPVSLTLVDETSYKFQCSKLEFLEAKQVSPAKDILVDVGVYDLTSKTWAED
ncbi:hypothetical protein BGZ60DRAFT_513193 [Tricladium varicosporioides]|nr:hypothetical protein BGZ60DRAFT_513193 [Hymenoscyphus varicosporioides]